MNGIISYMVFGDWLLSCFQGSSMLQHVLVLHSFLQLNNVLLYRCATFCLSMPKKQTYRLFPPLEHYVCISYSVMSNSLQPHGLYPTRLLCPWDSPGKNTGVGCHDLQGSSWPRDGTMVSHIAGRFLIVWTYNATINIHVQVCMWAYVFISLGRYLEWNCWVIW